MHRYALSGLLILLVAACDRAGESASSLRTDAHSGNKTLRIAVIPKGTTHVFWKSVHAGALKAAQELGRVEIQWKGALLENDREGQINVVQDFVAQAVDGIVLAPLDSTALVPAVVQAREAGIPTVIFDSGLADESVTVSYVATDNYNGGAIAAREIGNRLDGKGNVILLRYNVGSESTEQRERGFLETMRKEFPGIKMLSDDQYSGTTPLEAQNKALELCNQFGDKLDGFFSVCEPNTMGVLGALEQEGLAGKVKFVGFDPGPQLVQALADKKIHGLVLQDPVAMGYESVKTLVAHLRGEKVQKRIPTGEIMATPENMNDPQIKKLLDPEQAN
ncbi:MAG: substrate-binding domain-containing protein [Planctomycetia bacterium]|nr:substrate-binding domain-containing protein [Planctomycetia bacterium]